MTPPLAKLSTGTPRIVWGSVLLAGAALQLVNMLGLLIVGGTEYILGPVVAVLVLVGIGVAILVAGLDQRKKFHTR